MAADGPRAALRLIESHREIDLLFTDIVMPEMNGKQMADKAIEMRPGLRVLFTTGYTQNAIVHGGRLDPGVKLLGKPYRREELARKIRDVLALAQPASIMTMHSIDASLYGIADLLSDV